MTDLITEARELIEALHAGEYDDEYIRQWSMIADEMLDYETKPHGTLEGY